MGQTLSEPITTKNSKVFEDARLSVAMEDAHTAMLKLPGHDSETCSFFAVFDGHGGTQFELKEWTWLIEGKFGDALIQAYLKADTELLAHPEFKTDPSGATAISCLITQDRIFVANAGDSRCIISVNGVAKPLSVDHKPSLLSESNRIRDAGGFVEFGRVNGNLALSRAIGDFDFKKNANLPPEKQIVTAFPEIMEHALTHDVDFVVLACDGIWDCISNDDLVHFISERIVRGMELDKICEEVMDWCLAPNVYLGAVGCDNMSIILVGCLQGRSKQQWVEKVKQNLKNMPERHLVSPFAQESHAAAPAINLADLMIQAKEAAMAQDSAEDQAS